MMPIATDSAFPLKAQELGAYVKQTVTKAKDKVVGMVSSIGESDRAGFDVPTDNHALKVPLQSQVGNACGTTSLSMVMTYFHGESWRTDVKNIDRFIRPNNRDGSGVDSFTSPHDLRLYAKLNGQRSSLTNHASFNDLTAMIDNGVPPIILTDWTDHPQGTSLHYVVVSGYKEVNGDRQWLISNPWGHVDTLTDDQLHTRWSHIRLKAGPVTAELPYDRLMFTTLPRFGDIKKPNGQTQSPGDVELPPDNAPRLPGLVASLVNAQVKVINKTQDAVRSGYRWLAKTF